MEKKIIPTCVADNKLNALIKEVELGNKNNKFKIENFNRNDFFQSTTSFVIVDEDIFFEVIEKELPFKQIILIRKSVKNIKIPQVGQEIISLNIPFRFGDLYQIISNRLDLIVSQNKREIKFNSFTYDPRTQSLYNKNFSIRFTEKESKIFEYFLQKPNQYLSKNVLLKEIWHYSENIDTHTLETHIYSLRKKISKNLTLKELINFEEKKGYLLNKFLL